MPLALIRDQVKKMFEEKKNVEDVAGILQRYFRVVEISKEEQHKIDFTLKLKTRMPDGWKWGDGPDARLTEAGIVVDYFPSK